MNGWVGLHYRPSDRLIWHWTHLNWKFILVRTSLRSWLHLVQLGSFLCRDWLLKILWFSQRTTKSSLRALFEHVWVPLKTPGSLYTFQCHFCLQHFHLLTLVFLCRSHESVCMCTQDKDLSQPQQICKSVTWLVMFYLFMSPSHKNDEHLFTFFI